MYYPWFGRVRGRLHVAEKTRLPQIGSGHVRAQVTHLLGDDRQRQPVLRVPDEFPHPLLGVRVALITGS